MATRDDDDGRGDYNRAEGADITCLHVVAVWWESQLSAPHFFFFLFPLAGSTSVSSATDYTHHHRTTTTCLIISRTVI